MKKRFLSFLLAMSVLLTLIPISIFAQESNEQKIYKYLTGTMGLNCAAACGVLSNLEAESAFNPAASGDSGTSYGICQWHNERWTNLKKYCNATGYNWQTLEGQLHYLEYELTLSYPGVLSRLRNASNSSDGAYQAAYDWCYYYEIPANKDSVAKSRGTRAQNYYWPKYGGSDSNYYISHCTSYPSSCQITLSRSATLYTQPTVTASFSNSVATLDKGAVLSCPRIWQNSYGNCWYEVIYDGASAYLSSAYADVTSYLCSAAISDPSIPTIHQAGKSFVLSGLITADWGGLSEVSAKVLTGSGSTKMSQAVALSQQNHYQLKGSTIDDNMTFGKLAAGSYTYVVTATLRHYYYDGSALTSVKRSYELVHADFVVRSTVPPVGDINLDGKVNKTDLTLAARHVAQIEPITDLTGLLNADVNGDGEVDSIDLTQLAQYISGKISSL